MSRTFKTSNGKPILIVESPGYRQTISLDIRAFSIGRHPKCSLVLSDRSISRYHATIAWMRDSQLSDSYSYWVVDGKGSKSRSRNGIFVNGSKTFLHHLKAQDVISFGTNTRVTHSYIADTTDNLRVSDVIYYL